MVNSKSPDFEAALAELEGLVERLERGDLPLDEALKTFERGVELTRTGPPPDLQRTEIVASPLLAPDAFRTTGM